MDKPTMQEVDFYNQLAESYDAMTRFDERLGRERDLLKFWVEAGCWQTVLDAACGTGLHAIALASLGIKTTASDASAAMLEQARRNAQQHGVAIDWLHLRLQDHGQLEKNVDAVLCLGNSLPHVLNAEELQVTLQGFHGLLHPGGQLIIQLLNYDRILARRERVVGINSDGRRDYLRYYTFLDTLLRFTIVTIDRGLEKLQTTLQETLLYPYTRTELEKALIDAGFSAPAMYADLNQTPWSSETSRDLVCAAAKPE
ncbi:MAG TPA: class I SAM-dependent methyltransferase [bacterium]|nr:class I SAM-dependent methyltransferase [bacterium]HOX87196.1 class I SAM-dependent methyltransferase [bacterium]HPG46657.1 class I SAM-dependent methyltransferase [bacterium]HPM98810.1 class I SAM-dependent methyltransferase [bacterium]